MFLRRRPFDSNPRRRGPRFAFTGQELDVETGLYYYGARYYDPNIGRFISADSIVQDPYGTQVYGRYTYCVNNPIVYSDPTGHLFFFDDLLVSIVATVVNTIKNSTTGNGFQFTLTLCYNGGVGGGSIEWNTSTGQVSFSGFVGGGFDVGFGKASCGFMGSITFYNGGISETFGIGISIQDKTGTISANIGFGGKWDGLNFTGYYATANIGITPYRKEDGTSSGGFMFGGNADISPDLKVTIKDLSGGLSYSKNGWGGNAKAGYDFEKKKGIYGASATFNIKEYYKTNPDAEYFMGGIKPKYSGLPSITSSKASDSLNLSNEKTTTNLPETGDDVKPGWHKEYLFNEDGSPYINRFTGKQAEIWVPN